MANRLLVLALVLWASCPATWAQEPAGGEFQVNSYTTDFQFGRSVGAVASDATGNFVVVWGSYGQDGSGGGIFGQRFDASGLPQGSEFQVNTYTTGTQTAPAVAWAPNGGFVVVWYGAGKDGSFWDIFGQRFDASGRPQGNEFQVNSYTWDNQVLPAVASTANGNFVVVWASRQDGSSYGIFGQCLDASGLPQGSEFQVNTYTTNSQFWPVVASAPSGNFVVVWSSFGQDGSWDGVFGQRFEASGLPRGSEFQVNTYTTGIQYGVAVASAPGANFVVVWYSNTQDGSGSQDGSGAGVFAQRFDASGVPQGSEFQVNSYGTGNQAGPAVASDASGNFVVAWDSNGQDGNSYGVFGQRFNAAGVPQGSEFQVNTYTTDTQAFPAVTSAPNGNFVVVWNSFGQDGSGWGIFGQRYGDLIFKDGFE